MSTEHELKSWELYTGVLFFFLYEVLLFSTVHSWYLFTSTITKDTTYPNNTIIQHSTNHNKSAEKGISSLNGNYTKRSVFVAGLIVVVVSVASIIFLKHISPELCKLGLTSVKDLNKYIAFQEKHAYGITFEGV